MRLLSFLLGFLLRKVGFFAAIIGSLFLGYLLIQTVVPAIRDAATDLERLQQVTADRAAIEDDVTRMKTSAANKQELDLDSIQARLEREVEVAQEQASEAAAEAKRVHAEFEICSRVAEVIDWVLRAHNCERAEATIRTAEERAVSIQKRVDQAQQDLDIVLNPHLTNEQKADQLGEGGISSVDARAIANKESELNQVRSEEQSLKQAQDSTAGWIVTQWARSWKWLAGIGLLVLLLPTGIRTISYFVLMPLVKRAHRPIHLAAGSETESPTIHHTDTQRTLTVQLRAGEVLSARSEHVRPVHGKIRSQLLYDWQSPFISFAAGLYGLSRIVGGDEGTAAVLATPNDPDCYLMRIDFTDHPGVVIHPRHVVGVIGEPSLETRWRWGIQSLATWQVRYIMFAGTGGLIVQGTGDVVATRPIEGESTRMEQHLVMGFDSRLAKGVNRTEIFWPYLWGKTPLVDDEFTGEQPFFWQKSNAAGPTNPIARTFDAIFSAIGKLLGF